MSSKYTVAFIIVNLLIALFFLKRFDRKGCIAFGYVSLVILSINSLAMVSWTFMSSSLSDVYNATSFGKSYTATVISYKEEKRYDSKNDKHYKMYQPIVNFTINNGEVITRELNFSTSKLKVGDTYKINFNERNDKIVTLGFGLVMRLVASFIFCFILTFLSAGIIKYTLGQSMEGYYELLSKVVFYFFIPFLMIGFTALLIYGMFYGNEVPWFITALLAFFALMLSLGTVGYLKMIFTKGKPKMRKVNQGKRSAVGKIK